MKILLVSENKPSIFGGIERHCINISLLYKNDKNVKIMFLSKENLHFKYIKKINKYIFNYKEVKEAIKKSDCDIVHVHGFASFLVPQAIKAAKQLGKKVIYTAHYHPFKRLNNPLLARFFFNFLLKPNLKFVDEIITINNEDTLFFKSLNKHVTMIPNWLSNNNFDIALKEKNMILFVGRNDSNKSPDYLLTLPSKYNIHCVTNRKDGLDDRLNFHFNISDSDLDILYSKASLLVAPSRYEAFSYVVLEALMHGTPVLVSENVRILDYLRGVDGVTVFKYGDYDDFKNKVEIAIQRKVDVERIKEIFNINKIKDEFSSIYKKYES